MTAVPTINRFDLRALQLRLRDPGSGYLTRDEQKLASDALNVLLERLLQEEERNHERWRYLPPEALLGSDPRSLDEVHDSARLLFPFRLDRYRVDALVYRAHDAGRRSGWWRGLLPGAAIGLIVMFFVVAITRVVYP